MEFRIFIYFQLINNLTKIKEFNNRVKYKVKLSINYNNLNLIIVKIYLWVVWYIVDLLSIFPVIFSVADRQFFSFSDVFFREIINPPHALIGYDDDFDIVRLIVVDKPEEVAFLLAVDREGTSDSGNTRFVTPRISGIGRS